MVSEMEADGSCSSLVNKHHDREPNLFCGHDGTTAAWNTILSADDSIDQHPAMICPCINHLDASGFSWTDDSIEDALFRAQEAFQAATAVQTAQLAEFAVQLTVLIL